MKFQNAMYDLSILRHFRVAIFTSPVSCLNAFACNESHHLICVANVILNKKELVCVNDQ